MLGTRSDIYTHVCRDYICLSVYVCHMSECTCMCKKQIIACYAIFVNACMSLATLHLPVTRKSTGRGPFVTTSVGSAPTRSRSLPAGVTT